MKRIGIFVDLSNLYFCVKARYKARKIDYRKFYDFIADLGEIRLAIAYGSQIDNQAETFIHQLKEIGFLTKFKTPKEWHDASPGRSRRKADWDVGITLDVVQMCERLDLVVLATADGDLEPVVSYCMQKGIAVIILACNISRDLRDTATECIEIPESLLEEPKYGANKAERSHVRSDINSDASENNGAAVEGGAEA